MRTQLSVRIRRNEERASWSQLPQALATFAVLLLLWWLVSSLKLFSPLVLPSPSSVWEAFVESAFGRGYLGHSLWYHLGASLARFAVAFVAAIAVGTFIGLLAGRSRIAQAIIDPVLNFYRPLPPLAYYTLLLVWFGIGNLSKVLVLFLAALPPIVIHTAGGVRSVREIWVQAGLTLGADQRRLFRHVIMAAALPEILVGVRVGLGIAYSGLVAAELVAARNGIGWLALTASRFVRTDIVFMATFVMGITGFLMDALVKIIANQLCPWRGKG